MISTTKRVAVLAFLAASLVSTSAFAQVPYQYRYGYNPYTGTRGTAGAAYNPYTGTRGAGTNAYNPYTGTKEQSRSYSNPYTGASANVQRAYNPCTGHYGYHYSYHR
jgi:hypothetical protein